MVTNSNRVADSCSGDNIKSSLSKGTFNNSASSKNTLPNNKVIFNHARKDSGVNNTGVNNPAINKNAQKSQSYFLKIVIRAQLTGTSSLPYKLGLSTTDYQRLLISLDDTSIVALDDNWHNKAPAIQVERSKLLTELMNIRNEERNDLITLLINHRDNNQLLSDVAATIIATACLNSSHLWRSLAFNERSELTDWIRLNFPKLAEKNKQMRWKRFFYLQLCKQGGDYICRAPSCGECSSFTECFLPDPIQ